MTRLSSLLQRVLYILLGRRGTHPLARGFPRRRFIDRRPRQQALVARPTDIAHAKAQAPPSIR
jgi:hypothetical protein